MIYAGRIDKGIKLKQPIKTQAYALCSYGSFLIDDVQLNKGDGAEITNTKKVVISAKEDCEILLIDLPKF